MPVLFHFSRSSSLLKLQSLHISKYKQHVAFLTIVSDIIISYIAPSAVIKAFTGQQMNLGTKKLAVHWLLLILNNTTIILFVRNSSRSLPLLRVSMALTADAITLSISTFAQN